MICRNCQRDMRLLDVTGGVEVWKCDICEKETIRAYGEEVIEQLPEVSNQEPVPKFEVNKPVIINTVADNIETLIEKQGTYGRLKPVSKVRNPFVCRVCKRTFEIGTPGYTQSDHTQKGIFPVQTRVCIDCGEHLIAHGTQVKHKKEKKE